MQPRKKKPFDRKNAEKFVVMPRSFQDPVTHQEGGSQFVLVPVAKPEDRSDTASYMGSVRSRKTAGPAQPSMYDEVDDMVRRGGGGAGRMDESEEEEEACVGGGEGACACCVWRAVVCGWLA